jgi:L-Ala-D/L-Glu epimerase
MVVAQRILAVREAREEAWLDLYANEGFTRASAEWFMPLRVQTQVERTEWPFPVGQEAFDRFRSPISIAADESVRSPSDIPQLAGQFNVQRDHHQAGQEWRSQQKALRCADAPTAPEFGFDARVGNMLGISPAVVPTFQVEHSTVVDLHYPGFHGADRAVTVADNERLIIRFEPLG